MSAGVEKAARVSLEADGDNGEAAAAAACRVDEGCADLDRNGEKSGSEEKRRAAETANDEDE